MEIVYQDDQLVAINKPAGMLVHRSELDKNETVFALQTLREKTGSFVYPIHRLDKPTSGVLLFGLNPTITGQMSELFRESQVKKTYLAVVRGYVDESGKIDKPLRKIIDKYGKPAYKSEEEQTAKTSYKLLSKIELPFSIDRYPTSRYSLVELHPHTGRRHQLRRHMKQLSHPIIGDPKYGKSKHNTFFKEHFQVSRLLLASVGLEFTHPITNEYIQIQSFPKDSFTTIFKLFNFDPESYTFQ